MTFSNNTLYLAEQRVSEAQGLAIHKYLRLAKHVPEKQVQTLIIDDCEMPDDVFAEILKGIIEQSVPAPPTAVVKNKNSKGGHATICGIYPDSAPMEEEGE